MRKRWREVKAGELVHSYEYGFVCMIIHIDKDSVTFLNPIDVGFPILNKGDFRSIRRNSSIEILET